MLLLFLFLFLYIVSPVQSVPISYFPKTRIPPSQRLYLVMDYYEPQDMLIVFSGIDNVGSNNDLWSYSLNSSYWQQIIPTDETAPGKA